MCRFCYQRNIVNVTFHPAATPTQDNAYASSADILEQLKAQLPEPLYSMLSGKMAVDAGELQYARLKIQVLEERLRKMRIAKYGPGSEKLSDLQLDLLDLEP